MSMIAALLVLAVGAQQLGPEIPAGSHGGFQRASLKVQEALQAGDFAGAKALLGRLAKLSPKIEWDDARVPAGRRAEFVRARDKAVAMWQDYMPEFKPSFGKPGDIRFTFEATLPPNPESTGPAGAVFFYSSAEGEPGLEAVIALARTARKVSIEARDVTNEVGFAIGHYLGLDRTVFNGGVMGRTDAPGSLTMSVRGVDSQLVALNQKVLKTLREAAEKGVRLTPAKPQLLVEPLAVEGGTVTQGERPTYTVQITNSGNSRLNYWVATDCGCAAVKHGTFVLPGDSAVIDVVISTAEFPGLLNKNLYIHSNDPEQPVRKVPIKLYVDPMFRFVFDKPYEVFLVGDKGLELDVTLLINEKRPMKVERVSVQGANAAVKFEAWKGKVSDPDMPDPNRERSGYRIKLLVAPGLPPGRLPLTIVAETDDPEYKVLNRPFYAQRGIVAIPGTVYFGEVARQEVRAWTVLSRPGQAFRVRKAVSDNKHFTVAVEPYRNEGEYKLVVTYDGNGDLGPIEARVTVFTDDPKQLKLVVPVVGRVR